MLTALDIKRCGQSGRAMVAEQPRSCEQGEEESVVYSLWSAAKDKGKQEVCNPQSAARCGESETRLIWLRTTD